MLFRSPRRPAPSIRPAAGPPSRRRSDVPGAIHWGELLQAVRLQPDGAVDEAVLIGTERTNGCAAHSHASAPFDGPVEVDLRMPSGTLNISDSEKSKFRR